MATTMASSAIPTGSIRTSDIHHFDGWIYLVHLIVIYTMMYHIPTVSGHDNFRIYPNGVLNNGSYGVDNSYGSPMTAVNIVTYGAWDVWTSGAVDFYNGYAFNSYGLYSPDTSDIQFVWMVFPSGFINHNLDYTYRIPTKSLSEHGRSRWPLACLSFWPHLRQLLLQFLRAHLFRRTSFRMK